MATIQKNSYTISIVIGTLNRPEILQKLLSQLLKQEEKRYFEVLVIDQSTEENYKQTLKSFPKKDNFHIIRLDKPNTCKYLNLGWQNAKAPLVLYLDDDVTITDQTIEEHINSYTDNKVQGVAGRVINDNEQITKDSRVGKIMFFGAKITKNFTYENQTYVDFPYGCNMSFRKDILKNLGGFDENLFPPIYAYNEVDMGVRITKNKPRSIIFSPKALVYHHQYKRGGTRNYNPDEAQKTIEKNYGYFIGKNYNYFENFIWILRRLPYQLLHEPSKIRDILKGYLYAKNKMNS
jgi:glycosyltransferase involved in cell wall biosynthesis